LYQANQTGVQQVLDSARPREGLAEIGMVQLKANDAGWPMFDGKFVNFPGFKKERWAYMKTYSTIACLHDLVGLYP
jgi:hypothetical protein